MKNVTVERTRRGASFISTDRVESHATCRLRKKERASGRGTEMAPLGLYLIIATLPALTASISATSSPRRPHPIRYPLHRFPLPNRTAIKSTLWQCLGVGYRHVQSMSVRISARSAQLVTSFAGRSSSSPPSSTDRIKKEAAGNNNVSLAHPSEKGKEMMMTKRAPINTQVRNPISQLNFRDKSCLSTWHVNK